MKLENSEKEMSDSEFKQYILKLFSLSSDIPVEDIFNNQNISTPNSELSDNANNNEYDEKDNQATLNERDLKKISLDGYMELLYDPDNSCIGEILNLEEYAKYHVDLNKVYEINPTLC